MRTLTGKKPGAIGPPGIPSFGGNWLNGLGAGPAFYSIDWLFNKNVNKINQ